jgi:hypothetical protein
MRHNPGVTDVLSFACTAFFAFRSSHRRLVIFCIFLHRIPIFLTSALFLLLFLNHTTLLILHLLSLHFSLGFRLQPNFNKMTAALRRTIQLVLRQAATISLNLLMVLSLAFAAGPLQRQPHVEGFVAGAIIHFLSFGFEIGKWFACLVVRIMDWFGRKN